ncbi:hypothetical protein N5P37_004560 [Trichoderma harzianum]|uniref:Uncharacterized protein n=1 Tax=Trichoderma harzianum CBS 226.95 TaxID=983964 RepID=A0A2T3ZXH7_TRIHA|nr:hypothetical protein M431DRAFT_20650 [Trichoderma harzianum CBS 226.95]KAK0761761.1 hypothetical protein N5P37_004560 [Trichoderma harzianum]PKK42448.1 hypothetical protein CI102_13347 [Trichoderma harzianum]PTB49520.1 hypothetical protein M431DRAFT_20650 [Trichoderma harzianum CBS 226.95]
MMSRPTRRSDPTNIRIATPLLNNITNNGLEGAKEAFCSLTISERSIPQHLDELWQQLRRLYEAENTHNVKPFPYWALENLPPDKITALIRMAYVEDLGAISMYASKMPLDLNTEAWKFVLFFNYIGQSSARTLRKISMQRPTITFEQLYQEVRRNRLNRLSAPNVSNRRPKNPRAQFHTSDYEACLQGRNDEGGIDEEIEDESEGEIETGDEDNENIGQDESEIETEDEDNENIDQEPYFQLINENISMGHQEGDSIDGYDVENSHDQGGHVTDHLDGISTRDEEYTIVRDYADDTSASSPQPDLPTPETNSPIAIPDESEPRSPSIEPNTETDGHTLMNPPQEEARRQDMNQRPPSSPDLYSLVRTFASVGKDNIDKRKQRVQDSEKRFVYEKQQLDNEVERVRKADSILAGLAELEKEDADKTKNIKEINDNLTNRKAEWDNSQPTPTSIGDTSLEEYMSRAKSFFLGVKEGNTKRQAEESGLVEIKNKRAKLKAEFKELQATAANREPSLPIRSLESS